MSGKELRLMGQVIRNSGDSTVSKWDVESFEDEIAEALIALYEQKLSRRAKKVASAWRLSESDIYRARRCGAYIPGADRIVWPYLWAQGEVRDLHGDDERNGFADAVLSAGYHPDVATYGVDPELDFPTDSFCVSLSSDPNRQTDDPQSIRSYRNILAVEPVASHPRSLARTGGGQLFRMSFIAPRVDGQIQGQVIHFSIDKLGRVCVMDEVYRTPYGMTKMSIAECGTVFGYAYWIAAALQFNADGRSHWKIEAVERDAKASIGCKREEIKSLLYARSLPMTETGRKRPILHLVAAHRRRIKEGIEIDIDQFLRGVREVELNGTLFRVSPPDDVLKAEQQAQ